MLCQDGGREGAECLPSFHPVEMVDHVHVAGVGEEGAAAEGARPDFGSPLEPGDGLTTGEGGGRVGYHVVKGGELTDLGGGEGGEREGGGEGRGREGGRGEGREVRSGDNTRHKVGNSRSG